MAQLRRDYRQFVDRDTEIMAIGPESAKAFKEWWDEHQMPFTGIADPKHVIADTYGQQVKLVKLGRMPASILVDKQGRIRYTHFGESMADIPRTEEMLSIIDGLNKNGAGEVIRD
jgi:peroxiredoxin